MNKFYYISMVQDGKYRIEKVKRLTPVVGLPKHQWRVVFNPDSEHRQYSSCYDRKYLVKALINKLKKGV